MPDKKYSKILVSAPFLEEAVIHFVESMPERISEMKENILNKQFEELKKAAHRLKGAAGTHGYTGLSNYARSLEKAALDKNGPEIECLLKKIIDFKNLMVPAPPP